jgi:hypothetical protein
MGERSGAYLPLPKWRPNAKRLSCLDIISRLRLEMQLQPHKLVDFYWIAPHRSLRHHPRSGMKIRIRNVQTPETPFSGVWTIQSSTRWRCQVVTEAADIVFF